VLRMRLVWVGLLGLLSLLLLYTSLIITSPTDPLLKMTKYLLSYSYVSLHNCRSWCRACCRLSSISLTRCMDLPVKLWQKTAARWGRFRRLFHRNPTSASQAPLPSLHGFEPLVVDGYYYFYPTVAACLNFMPRFIILMMTSERRSVE
jgi:hypothetical protein